MLFCDLNERTGVFGPAKCQNPQEGGKPPAQNQVFASISVLKGFFGLCSKWSIICRFCEPVFVFFYCVFAELKVLSWFEDPRLKKPKFGIFTTPHN